MTLKARSKKPTSENQKVYFLVKMKPRSFESLREWDIDIAKCISQVSSETNARAKWIANLLLNEYPLCPSAAAEILKVETNPKKKTGAAVKPNKL